MAIYGLLIQKRRSSGESWNNRYYVDAGTAAAATLLGVDIAAAEAQFHGESVQLYNAHAWLPGSNPRDFHNRSMATVGLLEAPTPTNGVPTVEINLPVDGAAYENYKRYRVFVNPEAQVGPQWGSAMMTAITDGMEMLDDLREFLKTKDGLDISGIAINLAVTYTQLGKAWYNRI